MVEQAMEVKEIKKILRENKVFPSRRLGQNFLISKGAISKMITAPGLSKNDVVLEIGPGLGALTKELAKRVKKVIAIEKDPNLVRILNKELGSIKNLKIIQGDILKILNSTRAHLKGAEPPSSYAKRVAKFLIPNSYKVVANLPFYLTAPVIRKFLEAKVKPKEMILMVQKEVAQRICALPSQTSFKLGRARPPKMNLLAVSVQFYAKPETISYVSKESFWPSPKVDSAIIKITPYYINKYTPDQLFIKNFFKIVKAGFSHPRKLLINSLAFAFKIDKMKIRDWLLKNNIQPKARAENLSLEDWTNLTNNSILK